MSNPTESMKYTAISKFAYPAAIIMAIVFIMSLAAAWANAENDQTVDLSKVQAELKRLAVNIQADMEDQTMSIQKSVDDFANSLDYYNISYTNDVVRKEIRKDTIRQFKDLRDGGMEYVNKNGDS